MAEEKKTRIRKTPEMKIADIQSKIDELKTKITALEKEQSDIRNAKKPLTKKQKVNLIMAKVANLSPEELAKKLGVKIEE